MLAGFQRKYLRGLAHGKKPVVLVGAEGVTEAVIAATDEALGIHELIKVKFVEQKDKKAKASMAEHLARACRAEDVGAIGHTVILFRPAEDPQKRRIKVPDRPPGTGGSP